MDSGNKGDLLKSVKLLASIPADELNTLGEFLTDAKFTDGEIIFEEGQKGDTLYFISTGGIRIAKKLRAENTTDIEHKELAILGPGDCFGEMALIDAVERSADAIAKGETTLLKLRRTDLNNWLASNPTPAISFFTQLVQTLSRRLRDSSNELTLLFDLSHLLLEPFESPKQLLDRVMTRINQYLETGWCSGAYVYNEFNAEMDLIDVEGNYNDIKNSLKINTTPSTSKWLDDSTYQVIFPGKKRMMGYLVFHRATPLDVEEKNQFTRTMTTSARLITSALENIGYRTEEGLRARLKKNTHLRGY